MVAELKHKTTVEDFEGFTRLPENQDRVFEFIAGEIFEVPSNPYVSKIAARILTFIGMYLLQNDIGHLTGADGGYMVNEDRYAPDVAYISYERQPELAREGYNPNPPELAVEVISDPKNSQEQNALRRKVVNYLAAGVVVWIVNPEVQQVDVYQPGATAQFLDVEGEIDGGVVLPGFKLAVKDIFPQKDEKDEKSE